MPQELIPEYLDLSKKVGWRKPNHAFVSFKCKKVELLGKDDKRETEIEVETGLRAYETIINLNVAGVHRQIDKLEKMIRRKKWEVVAWGNFPKPDSVAAKMTKGGSDEPDDWTKLDDYLGSFVKKQITENRELQGLRAKLAAYESKESKKNADK